MEFVAWAEAVLGSSWPARVFVRSRSTDMLQTSHTPQKMMPCDGTSSVATVHLSISQHQTVHANPSSVSWLPLRIVHILAFVQRVFLGKGVSFVTCQQCETRRGFTLPFWEGVGSVTLCRAVRVALAPQSLEDVLSKMKQLKSLAPSLLSSFPVDPWREEHALRLCCEPCQSCFDDAPPSLPMPSPRVAWIAQARPGSTSTLNGSFS